MCGYTAYIEYVYRIVHIRNSLPQINSVGESSNVNNSINILKKPRRKQYVRQRGGVVQNPESFEGCQPFRHSAISTQCNFDKEETLRNLDT